jgi:hypothetical protein
VAEVRIKLEKMGEISINAANHYSEDTTIKVTAVDAQGAPLPCFTGPVAIQEDGTSIYSQYSDIGVGDELPEIVHVEAGGTTTFVAHSLAGPKVDFVARPQPAKITSISPPLYGEPLAIDQWVDNNGNGRVDWCERWSDYILQAARNSSSDELAGVTFYACGIGEDLCLDGYHVRTFVGGGSSRIYINPASPWHRVNLFGWLSQTVLHEARHLYIYSQTHRWHVDAANNDGAYPGVDDPDNDDDPGFTSDGDYLWEVLLYEGDWPLWDADPGNGGAWSGDGTRDSGVTGENGAEEADCLNWAGRFYGLIP